MTDKIEVKKHTRRKPEKVPPPRYLSGPAEADPPIPDELGSRTLASDQVVVKAL